MTSSLTYIDLFAGAGGLSEGFIQSDFRPIAHVEIDKAACLTLKTRLAFHYLKQNKQSESYISYLKGEIKRKDLYALIPDNTLSTVINAAIGKSNQFIFDKIDELTPTTQIDVIIGGPPCQAYSIVGRAPLKHKKNDERTTLYLEYGKFLNKYNPKIFVFENVPGILSSADGKHYKNLQNYYKSLGYEVEAKLLNAIDFGVIQNRKRVIIIGWKKELQLSYPDFICEQQRYTRDDIFSDLPEIAPGENNRFHQYAAIPNEYLLSKELRNGIDIVTQHITRPHNLRDLKIYELAIEKLAEGERLKHNQIPQEDRTQKNTTDFLDRFKVVGNEPHTMIAHIAKDGHHFIHPDKKQLRSISVREAARIQSFPDNYYFEGVKEDQYRTAAFRQIGNAVPPLMAIRIAEKIKEMLNGK
ncbi:DNA cytosine methyltransferase [Xanthocytophaga flava]|uniref:DNA cytosine methyltransferase n=1 Tax=Xanthocytophaga flava TaxID=3048013 RepID=UPI0028D0BF9C|nr:DNA cytosine methyltransferase [Xanthocytophaga flavus]MDJ1471877.1 DNA cytosine methyltransferase [Xanthocytophaga flavus]